jgi:anti-sigma B factor antagonist
LALRSPAEGINEVGPGADRQHDLTSDVADALRPEVFVLQASAVTSGPSKSRDAGPAPLECSWRTGFGATWVRVAGELDLATSPQLQRAVEEARLGARLVVLDLRELAFIDGSGVHAILDAARQARAEGRRLMLVRGPAQVDLVLTLTEARRQLLVFDLDSSEPNATLLGLASSSAAA